VAPRSSADDQRSEEGFREELSFHPREPWDDYKCIQSGFHIDNGNSPAARSNGGVAQRLPWLTDDECKKREAARYSLTGFRGSACGATRSAGYARHQRMVPPSPHACGERISGRTGPADP